MSYILEALKKSEFERQQGTAALNYSLLPVVMEEEMARSRRWPYYLLGAGLVVNAAILYAWPAWTHRTGAPTEAVAQPAAVSAAVPAPQRPPEVAPARLPEMPVVMLPAPQEVSPVQPRPVLRDPVERARPVTAESTAPQVQRTVAPREVVELRRSASIAQSKAERKVARNELELLSGPVAEERPKRAAFATPKPVAAHEPTPAPAATALPAAPTTAARPAPVALPSELPAVAVGGFIREEGSSGMVAVNDRLVREGDEVMPGLKVEKILNDSVVFTYKGQRFVR